MGADLVSIRALLTINSLILGVLIFGLLYVEDDRHRLDEEIAASEIKRFQSFQLADELRQSSDDLTRMARTYVSTGDQIYERYFNEILAIRNGTEPRPHDYQGIYWDFVVGNAGARNGKGEPVGLRQMMRLEGFTANEFALLDQSHRNSDQLVNLERLAMNAIKGLFADAGGAFTLSGPPDAEMARRIMFGDEYHAAKVQIMQPIDQFFDLVDRRTADEVRTLRESYDMGTVMFRALLLAASLAWIAQILLVYLKVTRPLVQLRHAVESIQAGHMSERTDVRSRDEIGVLAAAFNRMLDAVESNMDGRRMAEERLNQANAELEQRVVERTRALDTSRERYRELVEGTHDLVTSVDGAGCFTFVNVTAERVFGISEAECLGRSALDFVHPDDRDKTEQWFQDCTANLVTQASFENRQVNQQTGEVTHMLWTSNFSYDQKGHVLSGNSFASDITERKLAEEERLSLERQVQRAQKLESLGVLAGGIAHDFNNILVSILGNADLALDELSLHAPARGSILEIEKASKRAAELANQMLAYSGKGRFVIEPIDLNEFVEEMAHLLEVSISKNAVLKYNFADNLPTFDGDGTQIRQIIMNLIINASEAIGETSGVIALSTGAMDCDQGYLNGVNEVLRAGLIQPLTEGIYTYFEVADTGSGMDDETVGKIFDPFFTTKFTGRGLGMSAVLGIVRGHNGAIKVYSEIGKGTTFKVLFPANESVDNGLAVQSNDTVDGKNWRGSGTILIVDDEESVRTVGRQMLERLGFSVLTAPDGREALEIFRANADEIVCVLLDLTMPHMDGEQTFREIRRVRPDAKVLLCSGYNMQDATQRFAGKGLASFLQKPYRMADLKETLMEILADSNSEMSSD